MKVSADSVLSYIIYCFYLTKYTIKGFIFNCFMNNDIMAVMVAWVHLYIILLILHYFIMNFMNIIFIENKQNKYDVT